MDHESFYNSVEYVVVIVTVAHMDDEVFDSFRNYKKRSQSKKKPRQKITFVFEKFNVNISHGSSETDLCRKPSCLCGLGKRSGNV